MSEHAACSTSQALHDLATARLLEAAIEAGYLLYGAPAWPCAVDIKVAANADNTAFVAVAVFAPPKMTWNEALEDCVKRGEMTPEAFEEWMSPDELASPLVAASVEGAT
jgi:hypothetical protein